MSLVKFSIVILTGAALSSLTGNSRAQECNFAVQRSSLQQDIATSAVRLAAVQDVVDLDLRREVFDQILLRQHYPAAGDSVVVALWRRRHTIGILDSMSYEYWTIQIPSLRRGNEFLFPSAGNYGYYTSGGRAFVRHGRGFYGIHLLGTLTVREESDTAAVIDVDLQTIGTFAAQYGEATEKFSIKGSYMVRKASTEELLDYEEKCIGSH
jgi:hypothetical protein